MAKPPGNDALRTNVTLFAADVVSPRLKRTDEHIVSLSEVRELLKHERVEVISVMEHRHKVLCEHLSDWINLGGLNGSSDRAGVCSDKDPHSPHDLIMSDIGDSASASTFQEHSVNELGRLERSCGDFKGVLPENSKPRSLPSVTTDVDSVVQAKLPASRKRSVIANRPSLVTGGQFLQSMPDELSRLGKIVSGNRFETFFAALILMNSLVMAAELQVYGMNYGNLTFSYEYIDMPLASNVFEAFEWCFGLAFTMEWILRARGLGKYFFIKPEVEDAPQEFSFESVVKMLLKGLPTAVQACVMRCFLPCFHWLGRVDYWSVLDTMIVLLWLATTIDSFSDIARINPTILKMMRLGKLLRMLRLVRAIRSFDSLYLLTTTLKGSGSALLWSMMLLLLLQAMCSFILCQLLQPFYMDEERPLEVRHEVFQYFGTFSRTMLTMFELTLGNWVPVSRMLMEKVSEWYVLFTFFHKCVVGFAVVNVINGVFLQKTFAVAAADDHIMISRKARAEKVHAVKMKQLFETADLDRDNLLDRNEFRNAMKDPVLKDWLAAMEITILDEDAFFELIACGDSHITQEELSRETARLKGNARSVDMELRFLEIAKMLRRQQDAIDSVKKEKHLTHSFSSARR
eukprot:TRINITY_DN12451_c0_g3_i2.p1 TRINITY_DN12451_c0_g3~~TRINITY_DN12451_c0_g3_i2.p1  ORF type:complete len:669 (-),score=116.82 TRINITY_DN12451_c0_g3_i2:19-1908(-)